MTLDYRYIVYPEGDIQEIDHTLRFNQVVGLNGVPLRLPLETVKMIAYRVSKISTDEKTGERCTYYHLDLLKRDEMYEIAL